MRILFTGALALLMLGCGGDTTTTVFEAVSTTEIVQIDEAAELPTEVPTEVPTQSVVVAADTDDAAPQDTVTLDAVAIDAGTIDAGLFPIVLDVSASMSGGQTWRFDVTLSSEYDSPSRYADAWRVLDADDTELGIRVLTHDHASEQPFTRSTSVDVPAGVTTVFVEGRDQANGWSGQRFEVVLQ